MDTQTEKILEYLKTGKSLTPLEALNLFGCFRLGARIWDLKAEGHNIQSEMVKENGKHYAKYFLIDEPKPDEHSEIYAHSNLGQETKANEYFCKGKQLAYLI